MDWASFIFGAFVSCVLGFGASAAALTVVMRRQYILWMAIRALAVGCLVMTFPPVGPMLFPDPAQFWVARLASTDLAVAVTGPLLSKYIEPGIVAPRLRTWLWSMLPLGMALALSTPLMVTTPSLFWVHNLVILAMVLMLFSGAIGAIRLGSRTARFQTAAWAPGIAVGFVALYFELVLRTSMPFYAEAMLAAFLFEFVVTAAGIGDGFMVLARQRDKAELDAQEATIASGLDPLTAIANRRGIAQRFADPDYPRPTALAVIDCDHFKRINDNFGHDMGDGVLTAVAGAIAGDGIFAGRLGGEEFVALVYCDDWQRAVEDARQRIEFNVRMRIPKLAFPVTATAGMTRVTESDTLETAIKRADRALYAGKDAGRDRSFMIDEAAPKGARLQRVF